MYGGSAVACFTGQNPEFDNCIFRDNVSNYKGGAVNLMESSTRFTNCVFSHNQAFVGGGAVAVVNPSNTVFENCAFFENTSEQGGAMDLDHAGPVTLNNCTFSRNHSPAGAHIALTFAFDDTLIVDNSILAFGSESEAVFTDETGTLILSCVDIFGNTGGDWVGSIEDQAKIRGNLSADPLFCGLANPLMPLTLTTDSPCAPGNNPGCGLIGAFPVGCGQVAGADGPPSTVADFRLLPCYPNPFNPNTTISFEMDAAADVSVAVYDVSGELVRTLVDGFYSAGMNSTVWQGKNNHDQPVASGVYFARLRVGHLNDYQKMILLK